MKENTDNFDPFQSLHRKYNLNDDSWHEERYLQYMLLIEE